MRCWHPKLQGRGWVEEVYLLLVLQYPTLKSCMQAWPKYCAMTQVRNICRGPQTAIQGHPEFSQGAFEHGLSRFQFQGFSGCSSSSGQVGAVSAPSAEACGARCEEAPGCIAFLFGRRHWGCSNFLGSCHLYTSCFPEHNPCWEQYLLLP